MAAGPDNRLLIAEYRRWGGSLRDNLARVMATNLSWRIGSEQVYALPWAIGIDADYRVALNVYRCDGMPGDEARLDADWVVLDRNARALTPLRKVALRAPAEDGYAGLVRALDGLVARLAALVSEQLVMLHRQRATAAGTP